jgi:rhodanese-related sulfurtransferase
MMRAPWAALGTNQRLASVALILAVLAAFAGDPYRAGSLDAKALAAEVEAERDHIDAVALARRIRAGEDGLRVIDLRTADAYHRYHVPTAERLSLPDLIDARTDPDETLVLYSDGGSHAALAWVLLRGRGRDNVFVLRDGLYGWLTEIVNASLPAGASPAESVAFDEVAELSRYFGGLPRRGVEPAADPDGVALPARPGDGDGAAGSTRSRTSEETGRVLRRGC